MTNPGPVLVTGASGSIGSQLVKRLSVCGQAVRALVRDPERSAWLGSLPGVGIFIADLGRPESLAGCAEGCSLVYHCAAQMATRDWELARRINITGTRALLDEAVRAGVGHLVHTSTIGVYGLTPAETITEQTPWAGLHLAYFETKQAAERLVAQYMDRLPITIARLGDVHGPGQHVWTIEPIERIKSGLMMVPPESAGGFLNPLYIDNLLDALLLMGSRPAPGQVFNVVDGTPIRPGDYFRRLADMAGKRLPTAPVFVMKAGSALLAGIDILRGRQVSTFPRTVDYLLRKGKIYPDRIRAALGWSPAVQEEEAFQRTQQWLIREGVIADPRNP